MDASSSSHVLSQGLKRAFRAILRARKWIAIGALLSATVFMLYCWQIFRDIEGLLEQAPVSQPTLIFSEAYVVRKGAVLADTHLRQRLQLLGVPFTEAKGEEPQFEWKTRPSSHPESAFADLNAMHPTPGTDVKIRVKDGRIEEIKVGEEDVEALALDPVLAAQFAGSYQAIRDYVPLDRIPTVLKEAIISVEDQRFREHIGFDIRGLARAMVANLRSGSLAQGGSTITQQLVKNLLQSNKKTVWRKVRELTLAVFIEIRYEKEQILEKYLNEVYFGQIGALEIHGVADAAKYFYNKPVDKLTIAEMALLAGIIRGPAYYSPYRHRDRALARKDTVLQKLAEQHYIARPEYEAALKERIAFAPPSHGRNIAPYFADYVKAQVLSQLGDRISQDEIGSEGLRIYTTLDPVLQKAADQAVADTVRDLEKRLGVAAPLRLEGVLVAAEHGTGELRAVVGGRSYAETTFNRALNMKRSAGSTFKPFVYLAAFAKGSDVEGKAYTPSYLIDDLPFSVKDNKGAEWKPQNYDREYRGRITLREAFINSVNVPAVKVALDTGLDNVIDAARKLGISSDLMAVPSLALGTFDVEAVELLQAYSTIANRGVRLELTAVKLVTDKEGATLARFLPRRQDIMEPSLFELLATLMHDVTLRGTARPMKDLGYGRPSFGKTGTTSFYRDSWFAGFSEGLATVTWVGFDELKEAENNKIKLTGTTAALPVWARFYAKAFPGKPAEEAAVEYEHLERKTIDRTRDCQGQASEPENTVEEYYLHGTAPEDCP